MTESNKLLFIVSTALFAWLFYLLSPVLIPFLVSALLAYLADPIVDKLEEKKCSRALAVSLVFSVLFIVMLILMLVLLPLLTTQITSLIKRLPEYLTLIQSHIEPWLMSLGLPAEILDMSTLKHALTQYWSNFGHVAGNIFETMTRSSMAILQWIINLALVPVVTVYLLRDWDLIVERSRE